MQTDSALPRRGSNILLLTDVIALLDRDPKTLRGDVRKGWLPRPRSVGKTIYWLREELESWLERQPPAEAWVGPTVEDACQEEAEAA